MNYKKHVNGNNTNGSIIKENIDGSSCYNYSNGITTPWYVNSTNLIILYQKL